jgi:acetyl esterase/lipase
MKKIVAVMLLMMLSVNSLARGEENAGQVQPDAEYTFKTVGELELQLNVYQPKDFKATDQRPAIVLFFGGGWVGGDKNHFKRQAIRYAELGMVAITPDYRTRKKNETTPFECVADAKSAMRWVRKNAEKLGINPNMIAAGGGSAGGHLAAATALVKDFDDPQDNTSVSPVPQLLVLFNPVIDNGPGGYGNERIKDKYPQFSPLHNIVKGAPPTLFMLGDKDKLIPVATGEAYKQKMEEVGSECELIIYKDQGHGFFNKGESFTQTLEASVAFLKRHGYIK